MGKVIYLDNSATTPVNEEVLYEMTPYFSELYYNPSARYGKSRSVKVAIEHAREQVANLINANPSEIYFTSGGTESDNWAIDIAMSPEIRGRIVVSEIEHPAIFNKAIEVEKDGFLSVIAPVDRQGFVDLAEIKQIGEISQELGSDIGFASIMLANNEIGTIQPIRAIADYVHSCGGYMHTDAVQAVGNIPVDVKELGVDLLSMSSHKLCGPKGVGALYIERTVPTRPLLFGGGQEYGLRSGTENVPGIVGFGKACELAKNNLKKHVKRMVALRAELFFRLIDKIPGTHLIGPENVSERLPGNLAVAFEGVEAESLLMALDNFDVCCSVGSACSSNKLTPPRVLEAIGVPDELIHGVVRFSLGAANTEDDVEQAAERIKECVNILRAI